MATTTEQDELTQTVEEHLEALRKRFQDLELEQMRKGEIAARAKLDEAKEAVRQKRSQLESQLRRARKASGNAWNEAREGLESAQSELEEAVDRAAQSFAGTLEDDDEDPEEE